MEPIVLGKDNFEETTKKWLVLVDFWAEWCGHCKQMLPILQNFAEQIKDIKVCKLNVDDNPDIAQQFRVMSIPTLILFKDSEIVEQMVWVQDLKKLKEVCSKYS